MCFYISAHTYKVCVFVALSSLFLCSSYKIKWEEDKEEDEEGEEEVDEEKAQVTWYSGPFNVRASIRSDQPHHVEGVRVYVHS